MVVARRLNFLVGDLRRTVEVIYAPSLLILPLDRLRVCLTEKPHRRVSDCVTFTRGSRILNNVALHETDYIGLGTETATATSCVLTTFAHDNPSSIKEETFHISSLISPNHSQKLYTGIKHV